MRRPALAISLAAFATLAAAQIAAYAADVVFTFWLPGLFPLSDAANSVATIFGGVGELLAAAAVIRTVSEIARHRRLDWTFAITIAALGICVFWITPDLVGIIEFAIALFVPPPSVLMGWPYWTNVMGIVLALAVAALAFVDAAIRRRGTWALGIVASCLFPWLTIRSLPVLEGSYSQGPYNPIVWVLPALLALAYSRSRVAAMATRPRVAKQARPMVSSGLADTAGEATTNIAILVGPGVSDRLAEVIHARLLKRYGQGHVALCDLSSTFAAVIESSQVVVALIGPESLRELRLRSATPDDAPSAAFVGGLVAAHLGRKLILPVLVGGARMPDASSLPPEYLFVARLNATSLVDEQHTDVVLRTVARSVAVQLGARPRRIALLGSLLCFLWMVGVVLVAVIGMVPSLATAGSSPHTQLAGQFAVVVFTPAILLAAYVATRMATEGLWLRLAVLGVSAVLLLALADEVLFPGSQGINDFGEPLALGVTGLVGVLASCFWYGLGAASVAMPLAGQHTAARAGRAPGTGRVPYHYFLSYRRTDAGRECDAVYRFLTRGERWNWAFRDLNTILTGSDFVDVLDEALENCAAVLAIIGPTWLSIADANGRPRIQDPQDYVRREIATALRMGKQVVPVLVRGASLPDEHDLPSDLANLARCVPFRYDPDSPSALLDLDIHLRAILGQAPYRIVLLHGSVLWSVLLDIIWALLHPTLLLAALSATSHALSTASTCQIFGHACGSALPSPLTLAIYFGLQVLSLLLLTAAWLLYLRHVVSQGSRRRVLAISLEMMPTLLSAALFVILLVPHPASPTIGAIGAYVLALLLLLVNYFVLYLQLNNLAPPVIQMRSQLPAVSAKRTDASL